MSKLSSRRSNLSKSDGSEKAKEAELTMSFPEVETAKPNYDFRPGLALGNLVPDFSASSTIDKIDWHRWISASCIGRCLVDHDDVGDSWVLLFSQPANFAPVDTTELAFLAKLYPEFEKRYIEYTHTILSVFFREIKIAVISKNTVQEHKVWNGLICER